MKSIGLKDGTLKIICAVYRVVDNKNKFIHVWLLLKGIIDNMSMPRVKKN